MNPDGEQHKHNDGPDAITTIAASSLTTTDVTTIPQAKKHSIRHGDDGERTWLHQLIQ